LIDILDATAGQRGIWFDNKNSRIVYIDIRREVKPDIVADYTCLPFTDEVFKMVLLDPPHYTYGKNSNMGKRYGVFKQTVIYESLTAASKEIARVLKPDGFLIFKWSIMRYGWIFDNVKLPKILQMLSEFNPLYAQKTGIRARTRGDGRKWSTQTYWICLEKVSPRGDTL